MYYRNIIVIFLLCYLSCSKLEKPKPIYEDSYIFITNPYNKEIAIDYFTLYQYENNGFNQNEFKENVLSQKFRLSEIGYKKIMKLGYPEIFEINDFLNQKQLMDSIKKITFGDVFRLHHISSQNRGQIVKYLFEHEKKHLKYFEKAGVHQLYQNSQN